MLTGMVKRQRTERMRGSWARQAMKALEQPPDVLISAHALPDPDSFGVARTRAAFDAIRTAARGMGLVLGLPVHPRKQPTFFVWGDEAEQDIEAALAREPGQQPPYDGAWPAAFVAWSDQPRATFLVVSVDPEAIWPYSIIAWGKDAERCLAVVEGALHDDTLWE
jgi:hypothetical protein